MISIYPNLELLIFERGLKKSVIASKLGITEKSLRNKMAGKSEFSWTQVETIQREFFPDKTKEDLFEEKEVV